MIKPISTRFVLALVTTLFLAAPAFAQTNLSPGTAAGVIVGVVVNDRQQPVARVQVQAFPVDVIRQAAKADQLPMRPSGSATTGADGRFQISGLPLDQYVVVAEPAGYLSARRSPQESIYATTFYPSVLNKELAEAVSAVSGVPAAIQLVLVRVPGVRISGSVVSVTGRPTEGLDVRLFHRFGGFGSGSTMTSVDRDGKFEMLGIAPGAYLLTIAPKSFGMMTIANDENVEFVDQRIEVQDRDLQDLMLKVGPGGVVSGRVIAEGAPVPSAVGLRVTASAAGDFPVSRYAVAYVKEDWAFRMNALSGRYRFTVGNNRAPFVAATRVVVDGVEAPASAAVEISEGLHDVLVYVAPREIPKPNVDTNLSTEALVGQFKSSKVFWQQVEIAKVIVSRRDSSVLPSLAEWLNHPDRHTRGNTALIFGGLGDPRGLQVIAAILTDEADRPEGPITTGRWSLQAQIREDRYYAAHLLGDLRDPRAIPILVPLLEDPDVKAVVPWSLGQLEATEQLIGALEKDDPSMRVSIIYALEEMKAKDAIPRLIPLLDDHRPANNGIPITVADVAKAAIARLQQ